MVLIDLTTHVPRIDPLACRTSVVVRVRSVEENHRNASWFVGSPKDFPDSGSRWLLQLDPSAIYEEGRNQRILDYLISPRAAGRADHDISSFRVATALPQVDRPWTMQKFWVVLHHPQGSEALPRLMVDHPEHSFLFELGKSYSVDSMDLPPPPSLREQEQVNMTFWDRLMED